MLQKESADGFARSPIQPKNIIESHLTPRRLKSMNSPSFAQRSSPSSGTTSLRATHSKRIVEPDKNLLKVAYEGVMKLQFWKMIFWIKTDPRAVCFFSGNLMILYWSLNLGWNIYRRGPGCPLQCGEAAVPQPGGSPWTMNIDQSRIYLYEYIFYIFHERN